MSSFPEFSPDVDPREILIKFLDGLYDVLSETLETGRGPSGPNAPFLFIDSLFQDVRDAWFEGREEVFRLSGAVGELSSDKLAEHQLAGSPLKAKINTVLHWYSQFVQNSAPGIFRRLLKSINTLLNSLIEATGVGGVIHELKGTVEDSIDDFSIVE